MSIWSIRKAAYFLPVLLSAVFLFPQNRVFAETNTKIDDKIIGSMFKALAEVYLASSDFERLKRENIARLKKMDDEEFADRYARAFEVIKDLPDKIKYAYEINEYMTRSDAIEVAGSFNGPRIEALIDSVPDSVIAKHFGLYIARRRQALTNSNIADQVKRFWNRIKREVDTKEESLKKSSLHSPRN